MQRNSLVNFLLGFVSILLLSCSQKSNKNIEWDILIKNYKLNPDDSVKVLAVDFLKSNMGDINSDVGIFYNQDNGLTKQLALWNCNNKVDIQLSCNILFV